MEDLAAAMRELALSIGSVKATVDDSQSLLREIGVWKPLVDGTLLEMRPDDTTPRQQLGRAGLDLSTLQARATSASLEGDVRDAVEFGSGSTIRGAEALASSLPHVDPATETGRRGALACQQRMATRSTHSAHPWASPSVNELDAHCVEDSSGLNTTMPTSCSMMCSIINKDAVLAEATSLKASVGSTNVSEFVGASPPSTRQQLGILKLDTHTPTTCSTDVLDIDTDDMRARREMSTLLAGLASTCVAAVPLLATTAPHPPDQPGLLLARPPPWPLWMASSPLTASPAIRYNHVVAHVVNTSGSVQDGRTGWLLHGPVDLIGSYAVGLASMPWDPGEQFIMSWLYSCISCQVNIFEGIGLHEINEATTVSYIPSPLTCGDSLDVSSFSKHKYAQLDGKCTQFDVGKESIHYKRQVVTRRFENLDAGTTQPTLRENEETWLSCWFPSQQNTFSGWFPSQQNTFSGQHSQGHVHMMVSLAPKLSTVTHTSVAGVIRCAGVCTELSTKDLQSELVEQHMCGEILVTVSPGDCSAHCLCTYALYQDHFGKHHGAQQQGIVYHFHARIVCRSARHLSYLVLHGWSLAKQVSEIKGTGWTVLLKFVAESASTTEPLLRSDGVAEREANLQKVQPIYVQSAWLHHLMLPLQQKHDGLDYLRRNFPMIQQLLNCRCDLGWYMVTSPLHTPLDPGLQLREEDVEVEARLLAHFPRAPAWGQAGIGEGGNVTTRAYDLAISNRGASAEQLAVTPPTPTKRRAGPSVGRGPFKYQRYPRETVSKIRTLNPSLSQL